MNESPISDPFARECEHDRQIDPAALDIAAVEQADLFFKWAKRAVDAKKDLDDADAEMDRMKSVLELKCRRSPEKYGITSVTEAAVKATAITHPRYLAAVQSHHAARARSAELDAMVKAMDQRKRMIEVLVDLHGQEYFAGPAVPRDLAAAYAATRQKQTDDLNTRQSQTSRSRAFRRERRGEST